MYLIDPHKKQYKANLHCHSVLSDGKKTPQELKEMYKGHGYSVLSITDHEYPKNHSCLNDKDFLTITGYEAYIRTNPDYIYDVYAKELHLNLFAREPENEACVCYTRKSCKYFSEEEHEKIKKVGSQRDREYSVEYINEFIRTARENGYIVAYNHPWWSMEDEADILAYDGFFSMEMCNFSSYGDGCLEYNGGIYDKMLLRGKRVACHGADDNHNSLPENSIGFDSFGAFAMIMPDEFTYDSVFSAMEHGEMYSSMGPLFKSVEMHGNKIHIECSDVERIAVFTGSKAPKMRFANIGKTINSADLEIDDRAKFVRVSICDKYKLHADTRGFFRDELEF